MVIYQKDGIDPDTGKTKYREACSFKLHPNWTDVMILLSALPSSGTFTALAVPASLARLPKGMLALINYTPHKMKFRFGEEGGIYSIAPYDNVYLSLEEIPKNHYIKVMAILFENHGWHKAYDTT